MRFLDLPKDLRLIVYEYLRDLPIKRKHWDLELVSDDRLTKRTRMHFPEVDNDRDPRWEIITVKARLVWDTMPGLPIVYTSRQIHSEATAVFRSKLATIKEQPIRLIATMGALLSKYFIPLLVCLASTEATCDLTRDPRKLLESSQLGEHEHSPATAETMAPVGKRQVQIAIDDVLIEESQARFRAFPRNFRSFQGIVARASKLHQCLVLALDVQVRLAPQKREEMIYCRGNSYPFSEVMTGGLRPCFDEMKEWEAAQGVEGLPKGGEYIEEEEWERGWTEGERYV
jgi:hypothetical protein